MNLLLLLLLLLLIIHLLQSYCSHEPISEGRALDIAQSIADSILSAEKDIRLLTTFWSLKKWSNLKLFRSAVLCSSFWYTFFHFFFLRTIFIPEENNLFFQRRLRLWKINCVPRFPLNIREEERSALSFPECLLNQRARRYSIPNTVKDCANNSRT